MGILLLPELELRICAGPRQRSLWHLGRGTTPLHLYSRELHRVFIWPTVFLMVIAITSEIPTGWEQLYFIHSKVPSIQRCIMFDTPPRKKRYFQLKYDFWSTEDSSQFHCCEHVGKKVTLELLKYMTAFVVSHVLASLEVKIKHYFQRAVSVRHRYYLQGMRGQRLHLPH